jgi:hypothetical protein
LILPIREMSRQPRYSLACIRAEEEHPGDRKPSIANDVRVTSKA